MKVLGFAIFAALSAAYAAPITFQFTGTVVAVGVDDIYGDIAFGDAFVGTYTFESAASDLIPGDSSSGSYTSSGAPYGLSVTVAGHNFSTSDSLNIGIFDSILADMYLVLAASSVGDLTIELSLLDFSALAFSSDTLPLSPPVLAGFGIADFHFHQVIDFAELQVDGQLTSLTCVEGCGTAQPVPEPGAGLLVAAGLAILAVLRARSIFSTQ